MSGGCPPGGGQSRTNNHFITGGFRFDDRSLFQRNKRIKGRINVKSVNTVKNYLAALNDVYLFFFTDLFDYSIKRQIYNPSKVYAVDTAMINTVSFRFSRNIGHLYENLVFLELKKAYPGNILRKNPQGQGG